MLASELKEKEQVDKTDSEKLEQAAADSNGHDAQSASFTKTEDRRVARVD